jgi:hypothetical protein
MVELEKWERLATAEERALLLSRSDVGEAA